MVILTITLTGIIMHQPQMAIWLLILNLKLFLHKQGSNQQWNRQLSCLSTPVMVRVRSNRRRTAISVTAGLLAKLAMIQLSQLTKCRRSRKMQIIDVRWGRVLMPAGTVQNRDV